MTAAARAGYCRTPAVHGDRLVFVAEDDLWVAPLAGGEAQRLTAGLAEVSHPAFSPCGRFLAFTGREEGHVEVYVMPSEGGEARRLTHLGGVALVSGWRPDGSGILFSTSAEQPFHRVMQLFEVAPEGGLPRSLHLGPSRHVAFAPPPMQGMVIGRHTSDASRWKRYLGGTAGVFWIDREGQGRFERLEMAAANPSCPMWVGDRLYYLDDVEGTGNLYSVALDGTDRRRHTDHEGFYARQAATDGKTIVYHLGADLYAFDLASGETRLVPLHWRGPAPQRQRKFADAARHLDGVALHPKAARLALTTRGRLFTLGAHAGGVLHLSGPQGVRHRLPAFLHEGKALAWVDDASGDERVAFGPADGSEPPTRLEDYAFGRALELVASPTSNRLALVNQAHELHLVDVEAKTGTRLDVGTQGALGGVCFSPDGAWLAYHKANGPKTTAIFVVELATQAVHQVTEPVLHDMAPAWDPKGRYLYFVSRRYFDPHYDHLHFELGFPLGDRPCFVALRPEVPNPLVPKVEGEGEEDAKEDAKAPEEAQPKETEEPKAEASKEGAAPEAKAPAKPEPVRIDLAGISERLAPLPVPEGRYHQVLALANKVLMVSTRPAGNLRDDWAPAAPAAKGRLEAYDFGEQKLECLIEGMTEVLLSQDGARMLVQVGDRLRLLGAGEKPKADGGEAPGKASGWVDLARVRVEIEPRAEWRQMVREAWRLMRDHFWVSDMSKVDWVAVAERYLPLVDRVATRSELSDLMWEMQGELGTSHAYEWGGDHRPVARRAVGHLGAHFTWDATAQGYRITHIVAGDPGSKGMESPLRRVGVDVKVGDVLLSVGGRRLTEAFSPHAALVHQAEAEVLLGLAPREGEGPARTVQVRTLASEEGLRYRNWVEANRKAVHARSGGRLGYVHIPDMGPIGFAEFHRLWLVESQFEGLVVDVRNNGGGHVSQLLLEKLGRKRLGYDKPRYGPPQPYPEHSMEGPLVGITNEVAGSDGDIFSHCFRLMGLGTLIGKRTWGGVIGIWPRHALVDGSVTTQPEFSFWFKDVAWSVENHGAVPDEEVEIAPHDYVAGADPQLERAVQIGLSQLAERPVAPPAFEPFPNLAPKPLPPR